MQYTDLVWTRRVSEVKGLKPPQSAQWTVDRIVRLLSQSARSQFALYGADWVSPADQRELVLYRSRGHGDTSRVTLNQGNGDRLRGVHALRESIVRDITRYRAHYFRLVSAPPSGLIQLEEDNSESDAYQSLDLLPVSQIVIT